MGGIGLMYLTDNRDAMPIGGGRNNSLNTIRLLAAIQVLYEHVLEHLQIEGIPLLGSFIYFFSGVPIFFTMSGYLIWWSIDRSHTYTSYLKKRFWRIYPELWGAVAVEIIVLLLLYNHPVNWTQLGLFTIGQASFLQFWTPDFLRDYGCGTPNGALWTITVLIQFYICAFFIFKLLHNRRITDWLCAILLSVLLGWTTPIIMGHLPVIFGKIYGVSLFPYLWMFIVSSFVAEYGDKILPLLKKYWWVIVALIILRRTILHWDINMGMYNLFDTLLLFCGVLGFSYSFPQFNIKTDISYGIYIYHMTVVNAMIVLGYKGQNWTLWLVVALTCLLAWFSTITIGRMSIRKKISL